MTDPKVPQKSHIKIPNNKLEDQEWEFGAVSLKSEDKNTRSETKINWPEKEKALTLEDTNTSKPKTRTAMAQEMRGNEESELIDVYTFASLPKRALAFVFDSVFLYGILYFVRFSSSLWQKCIQYFMDSYKLRFLISESSVMNIILGITGFFALFLLIVIPVAFFNLSFGKKLFGLRIRCTEKYSIKISEAFKRELIFKPISILLIAGFISPFISKSRSSIHDMLAHTIVIDD